MANISDLKFPRINQLLHWRMLGSLGRNLPRAANAKKQSLAGGEGDLQRTFCGIAYFHDSSILPAGWIMGWSTPQTRGHFEFQQNATRCIIQQITLHSIRSPEECFRD
jgi:hypothetical protein